MTSRPTKNTSIVDTDPKSNFYGDGFAVPSIEEAMNVNYVEKGFYRGRDLWLRKDGLYLHWEGAYKFGKVVYNQYLQRDKRWPNEMIPINGVKVTRDEKWILGNMTLRVKKSPYNQRNQLDKHAVELDKRTITEHNLISCFDFKFNLHFRKFSRLVF